MSRKVRRVPATWEHPTDAQGAYIPMYEYLPYESGEIAEGLRDGWLVDVPPHYGCDVMPQWSDEERTHWQMYEETTEGTPISPVCATADELAQWLVAHDASFFASQGATVEEWRTIIEGRMRGIPIFRLPHPKEIPWTT